MSALFILGPVDRLSCHRTPPLGAAQSFQYLVILEHGVGQDHQAAQVQLDEHQARELIEAVAKRLPRRSPSVAAEQALLARRRS